MKRNTQITLTILFIATIFSVGIVQTIVELKKGENVQFFDALADTFITPVKKSKEVAVQYNELKSEMAAIRQLIQQLQNAESDDSELWSTAEEQAEEIVYTVSDLKKTIQNVNRHRAIKSDIWSITVLDSLTLLLNGFYNDIQGQSERKELLTDQEQITAFISSIGYLYRKPRLFSYPILVVKHFIFYTIFNREYLRKYENELEETSVFANTVRPFMQYFRYITLRDWGEKAVEGKNNWLFYKQGVDYLIRPYILDRRSVVVDHEDTPIMDNAIDSIVSFKEKLTKRDIELMVVIVPGKASIYPDVLSSGISADKAGTFGHSLRMMHELNARGIETVDLFTALAKSREDDVVYGDSLYLSQDTHWRTRGVQVVARTIADQIKMKPWYEELGPKVEYVLDTVTVERDGDVRVMVDLPEFKWLFFSVPFVKEKVLCNQVYQIRRDEDSAVISRNLFRDDFQRSKILVLGDSFSRVYQTDKPRSAGWISHLAYELSLPVCSIVSDGGASTLVREKLARKKSVLRGKKLVIWGFVERDIRYGAEGWKDIEL